jgi:uncharacterized protein with ATP-grasp and redox domains
MEARHRDETPCHGKNVRRVATTQFFAKNSFFLLLYSLSCARAAQAPSGITFQGEPITFLGEKKALGSDRVIGVGQRGGGEQLDARRAEWRRCGSFEAHEDTVGEPGSLALLNPPLLDPARDRSFARHTLLNRLPAVASRLIGDGIDSASAERLRHLAAEVPWQVPLREPLPLVERSAESRLGLDSAFCARVDAEWKRWTQERAAFKDWEMALPLISLEIYFYRRVLDCTGYFGASDAAEAAAVGSVLVDPFEKMKIEALDAALASEALTQTLEHHLSQVRTVKAASSLSGFWSKDVVQQGAFYSSLASSTVPDHFLRLASNLQAALKGSLWGNRGDLALAPQDKGNTQEACRINKGPSSQGADPDLLVDDSENVFEHLLETGRVSRGRGRVDVVLDNSGIELLSDLVLADVLLTSGLVASVRLHAKGEPLFISDAMPKDVTSHIHALHASPNALHKEFASRISKLLEEGSLEVCSHQFWTAPRLFWEMPLSLARDLANASLVIVKGDANYRRLVGDRQWDVTTPLSQVVTPWFPAPLLALRTMKAEIAVGLRSEQAEAAAARDADWWTSGKYGSIQFVPIHHAS